MIKEVERYNQKIRDTLSTVAFSKSVIWKKKIGFSLVGLDSILYLSVVGTIIFADDFSERNCHYSDNLFGISVFFNFCRKHPVLQLTICNVILHMVSLCTGTAEMKS